MNEAQLAWDGLFLGVTTVLLAAPLLPAWREWRHPKDAALQALAPPNAPTAQLLVPHFHLTADTATSPSIEASLGIAALPGSHFKKLVAPQIQFGAEDAIPSPAPAALAAVLRTVQNHGPHATRWGAHGWRMEGDHHIPASHLVTGPLVVTGALFIGPDCLIQGDIKAHGAVFLEPRTVVTGALVSDEHIDLGEACVVQGPVLCAGDLAMAASVVLGQPDHPTSVCAERITVQSAARVHGTVWARRSGQVT